MLNSPTHALIHAILQSLPCTEFMTTNYDNLFEMACTTAPIVLPYQRDKLLRLRQNQRWYLKLHGCINHPEVYTHLNLTKGYCFNAR